MPAINDPSFLRKIDLFRSLALAQLAVLNGLMRRQIWPSGARIMMIGEFDDTAYIIQAGVVKVVVEHPDGSELILGILGPGDVIATFTIGECLGGARSIVAMDETAVFWIDREAFDRCLQTMPMLSANLSSVLARRVRMANERVEALAGMDVRSRVVRHLLLLAREYGQPATATNGHVRIPLRLTQGELAHLVGASRVRVNQTLGELRRRQLVDKDETNLQWVCDMAALEHLR